MSNLTTAVTDVSAFARAYEDLAELADALPRGSRQRVRELVDRIGDLVVVDIGLDEMYGRLARGMPDKITWLDAFYDAQGWRQELEGY